MIQSICEVYVNVHILCSVQVSFIFLWYVGATIKSTGGGLPYEMAGEARRKF